MFTKPTIRTGSHNVITIFEQKKERKKEPNSLSTFKDFDLYIAH